MADGKPGRPRGKPDRPRREAISKAQSTGEMPSVLMLTASRKLAVLARRYEPKARRRGNLDRFIELTMASVEAAAKCATFFEYKLQALKVAQKPVDLSKLNDEQLKQLIAIREALAEPGDTTLDPVGTLQ